MGCSRAGQSQQAAERLPHAVAAAGVAVRVAPGVGGRLEVLPSPGGAAVPSCMQCRLRRCYRCSVFGAVAAWAHGGGGASCDWFYLRRLCYVRALGHWAWWV